MYDEEREKARKYLNGPLGSLDALMDKHYAIQDEIKSLESPFIARGLSAMIRADERVRALHEEYNKALSDFRALRAKHKYYY